jgi:hypothetical protein
MPPVAVPERKSVHSRAFEHYLRTGEQLTPGEWLGGHEQKFNPYHDPANGQFTFASGGVGLAKNGKLRPQGSARKSPPMNPAQVEAHAEHAMDQYQQELSRGKTPEEAAAWATNSEAESGGDPAKHQVGGGPGKGRFQWGSRNPAFDRSATFQKVMKVTVDQATIDQQLNFRDWELQNTHKSAQRHIDAATTVSDKSRAITKYYLGPADVVGASEDRARIAEAIYRKAKNTSITR